MVASHAPPTGDLARNPGMCPDWKSNGSPLVRRLALNPLSHTSQDEKQKNFLKYGEEIRRIFFKEFIYLFIFRHRGREEQRERNINVWLPLQHPLLGTWPVTQACAPVWESNLGQPFGLEAGTLSTEPHQPGLEEY